MLTARIAPFSCSAPARLTRVTRLQVQCVAKPSQRAPQQSSFDATSLIAGAALAAPWVLPSLALAEEGHDILKGTSVALLHPLIMGALFVVTGYAGWLGWQYRRTRTIGDEIKQLKKQVPKPAEGEAPVSSPLTQQIESLEKERKELIGGGYRDKHFAMGSVLLGSGVLFAVEGCLNTYTRTGKLFPGPHLFAGAGIVVLWALAAALVPSMQKGNEGARNAHIALNALNLALFAWQVPTGLEIVGKVFQFTTFP